MLASILAYVLGVPLWMIIGMLILVIWNRRRVKNQPEIFPIKMRPDPESNEKSKWPRSVSYAQWIHDVLIVRKAPALILTTPYGVKNIESVPEEADPEEVKGLGDHPLQARVRLDDDSIIQVALSELHPEFAPERFQAGLE
jgi:hypothetical protein